jgi:hypothetical protein
MKILMTAETVLEEETAIVSKQERYSGEAGGPVKCGNCGKLGHPTQACFRKKDLWISQAIVGRQSKNFEVICYYCKMKGHYIRNCPRNMGKFDKKDNCQEKLGNRNQLSEGSHPTVSSAQWAVLIPTLVIS